ncbi:rho GTPase-activating protein gacV-like [Microplitis mediator]|uniref:rho GTPase-activating protein gacV-like n=1 Tax=Microplitis mediator TaxID=375433 RepID=UPI002555FFD1|nr:rho GTPase-activating protein gacV-like [Microplitis mediator]
MRINIIAVNSGSIPRTIRRCRTYRNLVGQVLLNSSTTTDQIDDRIEEEEEEDMAEDTSSQSNESTSQNMIQRERTTNMLWRNNLQEDLIDKEEEEESEEEEEVEDDAEIEEANLRSQNNNSLLDTNQSNSFDPPEIKVTMDDSLLQMAHEYRENFDGFAEINQFNSIEELHDFIKNTLKITADLKDKNFDSKNLNSQEVYLNILLNQRPEERFRKLFDTSRVTVRRLLARNEDILRELFASASLDIFPSPLAPTDGMDEGVDEDVVCQNPQDDEVNENMKRWYMIEMIGLWLNMITDITSYREAIKKRVLMNSWGIENDQYEGIAVPLKYK